MKVIVLLLVFIGFPIIIIFPNLAFIADLALDFGYKATETPVQSPQPLQWNSFLVRLSLLTLGGMAAMLTVIFLFARLIPEEDYPPVE
jgi:hypothetical protein